MSDYTSDELREMLDEQLLKEEAEAQAVLTSSVEYKFEQDMRTTIKSSDYEMVVHKTTGSFETVTTRVHKSETQNKQFIERPYYWNETKDGVIVARAQTSCSLSSGSYGESYTPTLQILGTRVKDLTILKG